MKQVCSLCLALIAAAALTAGGQESAQVDVVPPQASEAYEQLSPQELEQLRRMQREWEEFQRQQAANEAKKAAAPTFKLGGQIVIDALWFSQDANSRAAVGDIDDALDFRRARLYGQGEAFEVFNYAMGFDFAREPQPTAGPCSWIITSV